MKRAILFLIVALLISGLNAQDKNKTEPLTVFLVRHAEKEDNSRDPELSAEGKQRAVELAEVLKSAQIDFVYSTDYIRTRETALPTAHEFNKELQLYNPRDLAALANKLKKSRGRCLVVGHSNTTPALVKLLGGIPGEPIVEKSEYDRLYILSDRENGNTETILIRYGKKFMKEK